MPLFYVQDDDRPMYVRASNFTRALELWKEKIAGENCMEVSDVENPLGVQFVVDKVDLIWE